MQGRTTAQPPSACCDDATPLEQAGAFALVLETVPARSRSAITDALAIPTIGIGAGAGCDGQVLVFHDLLGLGEGSLPRFVEPTPVLGDLAVEAVARYADDVRARRFPQERHTYAIAADELERFERLVEAGSLIGAEDEDGVLSTGGRTAVAPRRRRGAGCLDVRSAEEYDGCSGLPLRPGPGPHPGRGQHRSRRPDARRRRRRARGAHGARRRHEGRIVCYCHSGGRSAHAQRAAHGDAG